MSTAENAEDFSPCWIRNCPEDSIVLSSTLRNHTVTVTKWFPCVKAFLARTTLSRAGLAADDRLDHPLTGKIANENPVFGKIMTDLNSLVVFAHVVEANSFSGAARILKMPTSTVSRRIAELEDQLGMRLIERSTRRLRLTDAGSEVLEHARRMVELNDAVDNAASNLLSHISGTLRLASPPSISDTLLAPIVGAFQEAYPEVRVHIFITDRIVDHVAEVLI